MFIEVFTQDIQVWGNGTADTATVDLVAWPFNIQFGHGQYPDKVAALLVDGEELTQIECTHTGSYVTIKFPSVKPGGEYWTVRLRCKLIV